MIEGKYLIFRERIMRETRPSLYVGLELDFQNLSGVGYTRPAQDFTPPEHGGEGSTNLGLGLGVIYNNIHNAMNPRKGLYSEWGLLAYDVWTGSDFDFVSYISDTRIYKPKGEDSPRSLRGPRAVHQPRATLALASPEGEIRSAIAFMQFREVTLNNSSRLSDVRRREGW